MTFPNITPIEPGRDGWGLLYTTEASRLLYLCGLRIEANVVERTRTTSSWGVSARNVVKDGAKTPGWERFYKPTREGVTGAIRSLIRLRGRAAAGAVLHRYGAHTVADLDPRWFGCVYRAATDYIRENAR